MNDIQSAFVAIHPKPIEYRLYYSSEGKVLFYTCEQEPGDYIVIDKDTYIKCRHDIRVIDGSIIDNAQTVAINKMEVSDQGTRCAVQDVNIIVDGTYTGETYFWNNKLLEVRYG